jgi:hypothetical protein
MSWSVSDDAFSAYGAPLRARPLGSLAATSIGVAAILVLAGTFVFAHVAPPTAERDAAEAPSAALPTQAEAQTPAEPRAAFDLDAPEIAEAKIVSFEPSIQAGGRQETMTFGAFDAGRFYLRLDILQPVGDKAGNSDFFLDMARHTAQAGLSVARIAQPTPLPTHGLAFEAAEIRLSQRRDDAAAGVTERSCLAVRSIDPKLSIEIAGIACGVIGRRTLDRRVTGCLLDRLYYLPDGADAALREAFAKTRGASCFAAAEPPARPAAKKRAAGR